MLFRLFFTISCFGVLWAALGTALAAVVTVQKQAVSPTPEVAAYNLGHFFPGSNTADWWRYSRVSGARIFLAPSHFNVSGTVRPGEDTVVDQASFLARRAALRANPLSEDFVNWPVIEARFNRKLQGNNSIVPQHALETIRRHGGTILAQMTLGPNTFPVANDDDWAGKWIAWRTYYSVAFYLAREFDVERFSSHNEPNHPNTLIDPESWLMRKRLASDAAQAALNDVNRLYGKWLRLRFMAPVTATGSGDAFENYGRPALENIGVDFLGNRPAGYQSFHVYSYHNYNSSLSGLSSTFQDVRAGMAGALPSGVAPLPIALTEYNFSNGANYDARPESSNTLSSALRFAAQTSRHAALGAGELYAFKFGMTAMSESSNFPVQKNGMLFCDNHHEPHHYGTMSRSAEAYRLYLKGFAPGRQLLAHTVTGTGSANLEVLVSFDPVTNFYHIFSVNEGGAVPMEIDVSRLAVPDGNHAIVEDVSQFRTGLVRSVEVVRNGRINAGNQPSNTVWLVSIPADPQRTTDSGTPLLGVPAVAESMVRDGALAHSNQGSSSVLVARNDPATPDGRSAAFLQFDLPADWHPDDIILALLAIQVSPDTANATSNVAVHAHLYGLDNHQWDASTLTWQNAPNLLKDQPAGNLIRNRVVTGAGETAHILAQLTATNTVVRRVDVTDYLIRQTGGQASFLITQDPRWDVDIEVSEIPASWDDLVPGDTQAAGLRIYTSRAVASPAEAPQLIIIRRPAPMQSFNQWVRQFGLNRDIAADSFDYADAPLAGQGNWVRGPNSDNPSNHLTVVDGTVRFDWTTPTPLNNVVRLLWAESNTVFDDWIYATFDLRVLQPPQSATNLRPGFLSFGNSNGNEQRGLVGLRPGAQPGTFRLGISSRGQSEEAFHYVAADLSPGTNYTVTLGFDAATEETALWIDQLDKAGPLLRIAGEGTNSGIRRVNLRLDNRDGAEGTTNLGIFTLDNLAIRAVNPALIGAGANPSGDGLPNLLKFALGLDPRRPAGASAPRIVMENGQPAFHYSRNYLGEDIELVVEASSNLHDWAPYAESPELVAVDRPQRLRLPLFPSLQGPAKFLRVRATLTNGSRSTP